MKYAVVVFESDDNLACVDAVYVVTADTEEQVWVEMEKRGFDEDQCCLFTPIEI